MSTCIVKDLMNEVFNRCDMETKTKIKFMCKWYNTSYNLMIYDLHKNKLLDPNIASIYFKNQFEKNILLKHKTPSANEIFKCCKYLVKKYNLKHVRYLNIELHYGGKIESYPVKRTLENKYVIINGKMYVYNKREHFYKTAINDNIPRGRYVRINPKQLSFDYFCSLIINKKIDENCDIKFLIQECTRSCRQQECTRSCQQQKHHFVGKYKLSNNKSDNKDQYVNNFTFHMINPLWKVITNENDLCYDVTICKLNRKYIFTIDNKFNYNDVVNKNTIMYNVIIKLSK